MVQLLKNLVFSGVAVLRMHCSYHGKKYRDRAILSEMVRNVHSIEKGMCLRQPRLLYGIKKIGFLMNITREYLAAGYDQNRDELKMVCGALNSYVQFHQQRDCSGEQIQKIDSFAKDLQTQIGADSDCTVYGGSITVQPLQRGEHTLQNLLENRHSYRNFSNQAVAEADIYKAVELANRCPSACNRQTTRVYIIGKEKIAGMQDWLAGIGGFAEDVDKFLVITGRTSAFNSGEAYQHIVNGGIFAGTLTLCLSDLGIGSCVIQRPLLSAPSWRRFAKANDIPGDEELVCMMAVGIPEREAVVPVSYRLDAKELTRSL